jgi:hypothetical protein
MSETMSESQLAVERALSSATSISGSPKKTESKAMVFSVKLCSPLNHFVTSLGLHPTASASCLFDKLRFTIRLWMRLEIKKESWVSLFSSGVI